MSIYLTNTYFILFLIYELNNLKAPHLSLVISPLKSLMRSQVASLNKLNISYVYLTKKIDMDDEVVNGNTYMHLHCSQHSGKLTIQNYPDQVDQL